MRTFDKRSLEPGTCISCWAFTLLIPTGEPTCPTWLGFCQCRRCGTYHVSQACEDIDLATSDSQEKELKPCS